MAFCKDQLINKRFSVQGYSPEKERQDSVLMPLCNGKQIKPAFYMCLSMMGGPCFCKVISRLIEGGLMMLLPLEFR